MTELGHWGDPVHPPTDVSGGVVVAYEVVTVNADGTVDLRNTQGRAGRQRVPRPAGWTPTQGDMVLAVDVGGNPQAPAIISVQRAAAVSAELAALAARSTALEAAQSIVYEFPAAANILDIPVPASAAFVVIEYELLTATASDVLLRPNASLGNIIEDEHYAGSTLAPNAITHTTQQATFTGMRVCFGGGTGGQTSCAGTIRAQVRPVAGGRRVARCDSVSTNTAGGANHYLYTKTTSCTIDQNLGATAVISSLRFIPATGNFSGGRAVVTAR